MPALARRLAYHALVAKRLRSDPSIAEMARRRACEWIARGEHVYYGELWLAVLAQPVEAIEARLVDTSEEAIAMRQSTPFAGVLTPKERWALWRSVKLRLMAAASVSL